MRFMANRGTRTDWLLFIAAGVMWGSSYLFIKIGVETITPLTLVALRLGMGALILGAILVATRAALPRSPRTYGHLLVMSLVNVVVPFTLITWAELTVPSSLAAVLTAAAPLFTIVFAAAVLTDEPITANRVAGLLVGFLGVALIANPTGLGTESALAQLAVLGAAVCYAAGGVYSRRFVGGLQPMIPATMQVAFAFLISAVLALTFEQPFALEYTLGSVASVVWLGVFGSALAYIAYFRLLRNWGATRTSMIAYLMPVVGLTLGVLAGEALDLRTIGGTALVIGGIALVNSRFGRRVLTGGRRAKEATA